MAWRRLSFVYRPQIGQPWSVSHASLPVFAPLSGQSGAARFFFSTRNENKESSVAWCDIRLDDRPEVLAEARVPVLAPGAPGAFDDSGVSIGSVVDDGERQRLYYMGWNLGVKAPWRNAIGLALGERASTAFARRSAGPLLDRSPEDPYTLSYPWVLRLARHDWRMWYGSNLAWGSSHADMSHVVKCARSSDGLVWQRDGTTAVGFRDAHEYAIARPSVLPLASGFAMWFACRGDAYRIGAATSTDGQTWTRQDERYGLPPSGEGFDSTMTCYPCAFLWGERLWLAYNGNGYGESGFGLAIWEGALPSA